ncbi:hypothetical protein FRB96_000863 [Tulasnella sp. 330]|nr:hypothetical protein FRB96_000863 [Tulasnella sp. 330]KAG8882725.1 hypothetical protein FRB97_007865 [Tulasnella sp. 331]
MGLYGNQVPAHESVDSCGRQIRCTDPEHRALAEQYQIMLHGKTLLESECATLREERTADRRALTKLLAENGRLENLMERMMQEREWEDHVPHLHATFSIDDMQTNPPPLEAALPSSSELNALTASVRRLKSSTALAAPSPDFLRVREERPLARSPLRELILCSQHSERLLSSPAPMLTPDASPEILQHHAQRRVLTGVDNLVAEGEPWTSSSRMGSNGSQLIKEGERILSDLSNRHIAIDATPQVSRCTTLFLQDMDRWLEGQNDFHDSQCMPALGTLDASLSSITTTFMLSSIGSTFFSPLFTTGMHSVLPLQEDISSQMIKISSDGGSRLPLTCSRDAKAVPSVLKPVASRLAIRASEEEAVPASKAGPGSEVSLAESEPRSSSSSWCLPYILDPNGFFEKKQEATLSYRPPFVRRDANYGVQVTPVRMANRSTESPRDRASEERITQTAFSPSSDLSLECNY